MFDFDEVSKRIDKMILKLNEIGESLWHKKIGNWFKAIRERDIRFKFLEW